MIGDLFGDCNETINQSGFVNTNFLGELAHLPQSDIAKPVFAANLHR